MADLDKTDVCFDGGAILKTKENGGPVALPRSENILSEASRYDQIIVILKVPVPVSKVRYGLSEIFVIADRHVHSIQSTLPHLGKGLAGPVAVLQTVDSGVCQRRLRLGHFITSRFQRAGSTCARPRIR